MRILRLLGIALTLAVMRVECNLRSKHIFKRSSHGQDPAQFWPIASSVHGSNAPTGSLSAAIYEAKIVNGDGAQEALQFNGPNSAMKIPNNGKLDGKVSFTWVLKIYPDMPQTAVILEYAGTGSGHGVKFSQKGKSLEVAVYGTNGVLLTTYTTGTVAIGRWNNVGFAYNSVWGQIDVLIGTTSTRRGIGVGTIVDAVGDVTIGNSVDLTQPFKGRLSCVQFYDVAVIKGSTKGLFKLCDIKKWDISALDWTVFPPTTPSPTTTTTTPTTTTTTTTSTTPTTTSTTLTTSTSSTTTTSTTTTTTTPTTTPTTTTTTNPPTTKTTTTSATPTTTPTTTITIIATTPTTTTTTSTTTITISATTTPTTTTTTSSTITTTITTTSPSTTTTTTTTTTTSTATTTTTTTTTIPTSTSRTADVTTDSINTSSISIAKTPTQPPTSASPPSPSSPSSSSSSYSSSSISTSDDNSDVTSATSASRARSKTSYVEAFAQRQSSREGAGNAKLTNACYHFVLAEVNKDFRNLDDVIDDVTDRYLGNCAEECTGNPTCTAFVLKSNGLCRLSDTSAAALTSDNSSKLYVLKWMIGDE